MVAFTWLMAVANGEKWMNLIVLGGTIIGLGDILNLRVILTEGEEGSF